jgi:hypothetical protein
LRLCPAMRLAVKVLTLRCSDFVAAHYPIQLLPFRQR